MKKYRVTFKDGSSQVMQAYSKQHVKSLILPKIAKDIQLVK